MSMNSLLIFIVLLPLFRAVEHSLYYDPNHTGSISISEENNNFYRLGVINECFRQAIQTILNSCGTLDRDIVKQQSFDLMNCHLADSGKTIHICNERESLGECLGRLNNEDYITYSMFLLHADNLCFFHKTGVWNTQLEFTINRIRSTLPELSAYSVKTNRIYGLQADTERWTRFSLDLNSKAVNRLEDATTKIEALNAEIRNGLAALNDGLELHSIITQKLRALKDYQFLYENLDIHSFLFYFGAFLFILFISSHLKFAEIRFQLYLALLINYSVETAIYKSFGEGNLFEKIPFKSILGYQRIFLIFALLTLLYLRYKRNLYEKVELTQLESKRKIVTNDDASKEKSETSLPPVSEVHDEDTVLAD